MSDNENTNNETPTRGRRKAIVGVVRSDRMSKTISVTSERRVLHPRFKKYVKRYSRYYADDPNEQARVGDVVEIVECRPLSKLKHHRLIRVVRRGKGHEEGGDA